MAATLVSDCDDLQHLPDFKGIETIRPHLTISGRSCSTSLTSKGLRLVVFSYYIDTHCLQHLPDFKGIETAEEPNTAEPTDLQHLPDFKGIETFQMFFVTFRIHLQHLPDFKGIETRERMVRVPKLSLAAPP